MYLILLFLYISDQTVMCCLHRLPLIFLHFGVFCICINCTVVIKHKLVMNELPTMWHQVIAYDNCSFDCIVNIILLLSLSKRCLCTSTTRCIMLFFCLRVYACSGTLINLFSTPISSCCVTWSLCMHWPKAEYQSVTLLIILLYLSISSGALTRGS